MEYLKIRCYHCKGEFELYNHSMNHEEKPPMCPHCLARMNQTQWNNLVDAFFTFAEVNINFRKYHEDRGEPLFQAEVRSYYVKPEKIVLD